MREHWFWFILLLAVMLWYSTMTVYVAIRGLGDIKQMLRRLREGQPPDSDRSAGP